MEQSTCQGLVSSSLDIFKGHLGKVPLSARMGWNFMNNATMRQLEAEGISFDASCIPHFFSGLMYGKRDNFFDWSRAPSSPFHPNYDDYQTPGDMNILEIPVTTYEKVSPHRHARSLFSRWIKVLSGFPSSTPTRAVLSRVSVPYVVRRAVFQDEILILSPWRRNVAITKLLHSKLSEASSRGWAYLLAYFHPCELLNPINGKPHLEYLRTVRTVLRTILGLQNSMRVIPISVSEFGRMLQDGVL